MASQKKILSTIQLLVMFAVVVSLSEGFTMPFFWGRREMASCPNLVGNRDLYEGLSRICSDCQNIFRDKNIEGRCKSDCFGSSMFESCMMALEIAEKMNVYKMHASILKGSRK